MCHNGEEIKRSIQELDDETINALLDTLCKHRNIANTRIVYLLCEEQEARAKRGCTGCGSKCNVADCVVCAGRVPCVLCKQRARHLETYRKGEIYYHG